MTEQQTPCCGHDEMFTGKKAWICAKCGSCLCEKSAKLIALVAALRALQQQWEQDEKDSAMVASVAPDREKRASFVSREIAIGTCRKELATLLAQHGAPTP